MQDAMQTKLFEMVCVARLIWLTGIMESMKVVATHKGVVVTISAGPLVAAAVPAALLIAVAADAVVVAAAVVTVASKIKVAKRQQQRRQHQCSNMVHLLKLL